MTFVTTFKIVHRVCRMCQLRGSRRQHSRKHKVYQCLGYNKLIPFPFAHTRFSGS